MTFTQIWDSNPTPFDWQPGMIPESGFVFNSTEAPGKWRKITDLEIFERDAREKARTEPIRCFSMKKIALRIDRLKTEGFSASQANSIAGDELMRQVNE